jgi:hypothetical protein
MSSLYIFDRVAIAGRAHMELFLPQHSRRHNTSRFMYTRNIYFFPSKDAANSTIHHILIRHPSRICSCHYIVSHIHKWNSRQGRS